MAVYSSSTSEASGSFKNQNVALTAPDGATITLNIEVAQSEAEHAQGLMFRDHLDADRGMLFVFDQPRVLTFWMKNTMIPLDVLFFDQEGNLVSVSTMEPCASEPCTTYPSGGAALYALEVNAGFVEDHDVGQGWTLGVR